MIEVFHVLIDETQVIGVGPLMRKRPGDLTTAQLYNEVAFYFEVYTKAYHFTVTTDWLPFLPGLKEKAETTYEQIKEVHKTLRKCLIDGVFSDLSIVVEHPESPSLSP